MVTRDIPEPIKREVRKRCHFGCVICGMPVFEYDHIEKFAEVQKHEADNIVLLCPNHHRDKSAPRLSIARIRAAAANPYNAGRRHTAGFFLEPGQKLTVLVGKTEFPADFFNVDRYHVLMANQRPFLTIYREDSWMTLSARVTDAKGVTLLLIVKGELVISTGVWDYRYEGANLKVWYQKREIAFELTWTNENFEVLRGCFVDDRDHSGFIAVENGSMVVLRAGVQCALLIGGNYGGEGDGALRVTNLEIANATGNFVRGF